jgi:hypothetical protein
MSKSDVAAISNLLNRVSALETNTSSSGMRRFTVNTQNELPNTFSGWKTGDYGYVLSDTSANVPAAKQPAETLYEWNGTGLEFILIIEGADSSFVSSETPGKIYKENDGTGSVNGWDTLSIAANSASSYALALISYLQSTPIPINLTASVNGQILTLTMPIKRFNQGMPPTPIIATVELPAGTGGGGGVTQSIQEYNNGNGLELSKYAAGTLNETTLYLRKAMKIANSTGGGLCKYKLRVLPSSAINVGQYTFYNHIFQNISPPSEFAPPSGKSMEGGANGVWMVSSNYYAFPFEAKLSGTPASSTLTLRWGIPWGASGQVTASTPLDFDIDIIYS